LFNRGYQDYNEYAVGSRIVDTIGMTNTEYTSSYTGGADRGLGCLDRTVRRSLTGVINTVRKLGVETPGRIVGEVAGVGNLEEVACIRRETEGCVGAGQTAFDGLCTSVDAPSGVRTKSSSASWAGGTAVVSKHTPGRTTIGGRSRCTSVHVRQEEW